MFETAHPEIAAGGPHPPETLGRIGSAISMSAAAGDTPPKTDRPLLSIGIPVWNGEQFLRQTIESLLAQDYGNIELILLDNLSTDGTARICQEFAEKDPRVRFLRDTESVTAMEGHKRVARMARGDLFMGACDDDVYDTNYVSTLAARVLGNPEVGLAYGALAYISTDGEKSFEEPGGPSFRTSAHSRAQNFMQYMLWRRPLPMGFGVMRTKLHLEALRYFERVDHDHARWDHDNLWMLRLLTLARVDSCPDVRFYYRQQDRVAVYTRRQQLTVDAPSRARLISNVRHEIKVTRRVFQMLGEASFDAPTRALLRMYTLLVLGFNCGGRPLAQKAVALLRGRKA